MEPWAISAGYRNVHLLRNGIFVAVDFYAQFGPENCVGQKKFLMFGDATFARNVWFQKAFRRRFGTHAGNSQWLSHPRVWAGSRVLPALPVFIGADKPGHVVLEASDPRWPC
jgi:hypothetical protein